MSREVFTKLLVMASSTQGLSANTPGPQRLTVEGLLGNRAVLLQEPDVHLGERGQGLRKAEKLLYDCITRSMKTWKTEAAPLLATHCAYLSPERGYSHSFRCLFPARPGLSRGKLESYRGCSKDISLSN